MVAAIPQAAAATSTDKTPNSTRPPLLPSEKDHRNNGGRVPPVKPRGKQVPSRYLSPSPSSSSSATTTTTTTSTNSSSSSSFSKRFPSPLLSRTTNSTPAQTPSAFSSVPKRSQSVDRRRSSVTQRPTTPNLESRQSNAAEMSAATRMLITSTRSLSVSFQGEAFSLPISKAKSVASPNAGRKATPERRRATPVRDQGENSRPLDQHRWPARRRDGNSGSTERNPMLSRSIDCSGGDKRILGSGLLAVKSLQQSMIVDERRLSLDLGNAKPSPDFNSVNESSITGDFTASDSDSVSSGSTSGSGIPKGKTGSRGIIVSARFWQETNSRLRRLQDPGSPLSTSPSTRMSISSKSIQSKRFSSDGPTTSPRTIGSSPIRGPTRPASPSKLWTPSAASSPSRGMSSPSRVRPMSTNSGSMPSILSFSVDLRRGKIGEDRIVDAHLLRLLYNRYVQWRFVNARADATFMVQKLNAEKNLWNAWVTTSELRHSVTLKRVKLLLLRQKLKITSILKGQINCLEEWSLLDRDHSTSLEGAIEALKASTLRLPIVGKTVADVQNLKDAVGSAVDAMQAMGSSVCLLTSKVEEINSLVAELLNVTAKEKFLLQQCKDFLSKLAAMQVKDCSLRTHVIQLNRLPTTSNLTTRV
ncbi:QWRF motif-containing protein 2 [Euphorbia lathyris]|uniref:QWRF motif-containing protein 2 n=1 Tax=Euphorbia lathyris TaxID=212925 RepID=UPI00331313B6